MAFVSIPRLEVTHARLGVDQSLGGPREQGRSRCKHHELTGLRGQRKEWISRSSVTPPKLAVPPSLDLTLSGQVRAERHQLLNHIGWRACKYTSDSLKLGMRGTSGPFSPRLSLAPCLFTAATCHLPLHDPPVLPTRLSRLFKRRPADLVL